VYDSRIVLDAVQRYGQACFERDCGEAAALFAEVTRMITDDSLAHSFRHEEAPAPPEEGAGALRLLAS